jgi:hypothetical protein
MIALRTALIACCAILASVAGAHRVRADCTSSQATDACLVGTWTQTGGGAAEWMRQNMKMAQVSAVAGNGTLTFNGDGTFSTSKVDTKAEVTAKNAQVHAAGQMSGQGSGRWSAAGGTLTLCMTAVSSTGTIELKGPGGEGVKLPMPQMKPATSSMTYTCNGDALSTVQPMPKSTTMTTTYTKVH